VKIINLPYNSKIELLLSFLVIRIAKGHIISPFVPTNFLQISLKPKGSQKSYKAAMLKGGSNCTDNTPSLAFALIIMFFSPAVGY
jgi:hypothetical protein